MTHWTQQIWFSVDVFCSCVYVFCLFFRHRFFCVFLFLLLAFLSWIFHNKSLICFAKHFDTLECLHGIFPLSYQCSPIASLFFTLSTDKMKNSRQYFTVGLLCALANFFYFFFTCFLVDCSFNRFLIWFLTTQTNDLLFSISR